MSSTAPDAARPSLRVLMTADTVGGVWHYALELTRALAGHGVQVHLATMGRLPSAAQRAAADILPNLVLHQSEHRLEWMDEPWDDVARAGEWLSQLERELAPDVVHLNGYAHGALPWRAPAVVVAHSDVCSWWRAVHGVAAPEGWDRYRAAVRAGLDGADVVVAPTQAMLDALAREHGPVRPATVVANARRAEDFLRAEKADRVLTAGRLWDAAKNVAAVIAAAEALPWPVRVAGEAEPPVGAGGDALPTSAAHVRWLGPLEPAAMADELGRAAVYALPARYEPFGLSALEAGLAGCALVLGDVPSLREVWGDAALFVDPARPEALRDALVSLVADADRRRAMAERARAQALTYTPARMAGGYLDAYAAAAMRRITHVAGRMLDDAEPRAGAVSEE